MNGLLKNYLWMSLGELEHFRTPGLKVYLDVEESGSIAMGLDADNAVWFADPRKQVSDLEGPEAKPALCWEARDELWVNFDDRATRNEGARVLAQLIHQPVESTGPQWYWHEIMCCWVLSCSRSNIVSAAFSSDGLTEYKIPLLKELEDLPQPYESLSDGSTARDALALVRVLTNLLDPYGDLKTLR